MTNAPDSLQPHHIVDHHSSGLMALNAPTSADWSTVHFNVIRVHYKRRQHCTMVNSEVRPNAQQLKAREAQYVGHGEGTSAQCAQYLGHGGGFAMQLCTALRVQRVLGDCTTSG